MGLQFNQVWVTPEMRARAEERDKKSPAYNGSFTKGDRRLIGFIGEEIFARQYGQAQLKDRYDYDFTLAGYKCDVKSRIINVVPSEDYDVSVFFNHGQRDDVDLYVFVAVDGHMQRGWILGWLYKNEIKEKGIPIEPGEEMDQGGKYMAGGYKIRIKDMRRSKEEIHEPEGCGMEECWRCGSV